METVKPLCPYFGSCGGCSSQHIAYSLQVDNKKNMVINELKRQNIKIPDDVPVFFGEPYFYRNRMDFVFSTEGPGLRMKGQFNRIVPIKQCVISNNKINSLLTEIWQWFEKNKNELDIFDLRTHRGTLKYAVIRAAEHTDSSTVSFILNEDSTKLGKHNELVENFSKTTSAKNVVIGRVPAEKDLSISSDCFTVKGELVMEELIMGKKMQFSTQSFFQNNTMMAEKMVSYAKELLSKHKTQDSVLVDLYGGAGTFGVCLADLFSKMLLIEIDEMNVDYANENIEANNLKNAEAICGDASVIAKAGLKNKELFLITDPPRSGMHPKTINQIILLKPKTIIYVSCNPQQLARELKVFDKYYEVNSLAVFDLFPQTPHTEAIAELKLRSNL